MSSLELDNLVKIGSLKREPASPREQKGLRESALAMDSQAFRKVVHDGELIARGMPRYDFLSEEQVTQLYHYVRQEARRAKAKPRG